MLLLITAMIFTSERSGLRFWW